MSGEKNTSDKRKYFALPDLWLIGIVLLALVLSVVNLLAHNDTEGVSAVIKVSGEVYEEVSLSQALEDYSLTVKGENGGEAEIYITSHSAEFRACTCPDQLCVNTGKLTKSGDGAVCLPLRISVELVSDEKIQSENTPDAIVG